MKRTTETHNWRVVYTSDEFDHVHDDLRIIDANGADHPQGPFTVATMTVTNARHRHHVAAARLMAAAPEMLEALQRLASWGRMDTPNTQANLASIIHDAATAIAAATTGHVPDQRTDPFDEAHELYTHGATSGIADGDDNHITE